MNDPSGSQWRKWDLHFHTPKSHDYGNKGLNAAQVVDRLVHAKVAVVAVTDHHVLDALFISEMQRAAAGRITVLPGIELTSNLGGSDGVHFIAIFPETSDLNHLSNELMSKLDLATKRKEGIAEDRLYVEFPTAAPLIQRLGGIVTIHGHKKYANIEDISNHLSFKQQVKTDLLRDFVDIIELSDKKYAADYTTKVFPSVKFMLPMIVASDDHSRDAYPIERCCWIKADPTFAGLKMALREPETRFCLDDEPSAVGRLEKNKTRYVKSMSFAAKATMPAGDKWLHGDVPINPGLVAVIGNKGSGKSALADCLGLLGACGTSGSFSFLEPNRFCNPKTGRAQHLEATLHWHGGAPRTRALNDTVGPDEPERVKYLPQNFVEKVCNDLATPGGGEFERELKKVVFSKVPKADQLGKRSLDELVQYRTQEIRREADSLAAGLLELAEGRAALEERLDPTVKSSLEKRIAQFQEQITSHEATMPIEVKPPTEDPATSEQTKASMEALERLRREREITAAAIKDKENEVAAQQIRAAKAEKLLEKMKNLETEFERRKTDWAPDAAALGLDTATLVTLQVNRVPVESVRETALAARDAAKKLLDDPLPNGLHAKSKQLDEQIKAAQVQMDIPNQEYQAYIEKLAAWKATYTKLRGSTEDPNSLLGLKADLAALEGVPAKILEVTAKLESIAAGIHKQRVAEANVYRELYQPVQKFVDEHALAKEQLKMEFRVDLIEEGFVDTLVSHINQQRLGSFSGVMEGRELAGKLTAPVDWANWNAVEKFLRDIVDHLHNDKRPGSRDPVLLKNQIGKGWTVAELYAWLFGLGYVKPRYILKSDGKGLEQLSPGERGTLLLVFYLLVDDSDLPLIIDQPEANLDNLTVADKLVACIRDARERRQVIIVTHNPNLAVVCDADQIIHASMDITDGHRITYKTGALENTTINEFTIKVLEGGRRPFDMRDDTYAVCEQ